MLYTGSFETRIHLLFYYDRVGSQIRFFLYRMAAMSMSDYAEEHS